MATTFERIPWMTVQAAYTELGTAPNTVYRYIHDGVLEKGELHSTNGRTRLMVSVASVVAAKFGDISNLAGKYNPAKAKQLPYCSSSEAARILGCGDDYARQLARDGRVEAVMPTGAGDNVPYLFNVESCRTYAKEKRKGQKA